MNIEFVFWIIFSIVFLAVFFIDMTLTNKRKGALNVKAAFLWSVLWFSIALSFAVVLYFFFPEGDKKAFEYLAAYLVEYSLSVDNLFVFIMIFSVMGITENHQPRILKWGIIGAVVLRILFILAGVELLKNFSFLMYVFGAILVITAYKMLTSSDKKIDPNKNIFVKITKKFIPLKSDVATDHFFVIHDKKKYATIALITLILVESTDLIFAIDSIPAVLAITNNSFIAITSNLFAILGLRSLFFALSGFLGLFRFLKYGISVILLFIGVKMMLSAVIHIPVQLSLIVIVLCIIVSVLASVIIKKK